MADLKVFAALEQAAAAIAKGYSHAWSHRVIDGVMCVGCIDEDGNFRDFIDVRISEYSDNEADDHNLAAYLAMCRPAVVLDLVRRLRAAEAELATVTSIAVRTLENIAARTTPRGLPVAEYAMHALADLGNEVPV